jgi:diguanylate cyclase (GGDEF)-like protein
MAVSLLALIAMGIAFLLMKRQSEYITQPLALVTQAAQDLAEGKTTVRVEIHSGDEIEVLGAAFNKMASDLSSSYEALSDRNQALAVAQGQLEELNRGLEKKVELRTKELQERSEELEEVNQKLQDLTITDPLTGLRNRRFLINYIGAEIAESKRQHFAALSGREDNPNRYIVFVMVDLDHFKSVNDTHGHAAGDEVLVQAATLLKNACRESDQVIRWGGEEFLIVAPNSQLASFHSLAQQVVETFRTHAFEIGEENPLSITCSVGCGCYPMLTGSGENLTWEEVTGIADQALYAAKDSGRNMWVGLQQSTIDSREGFLERLKEGVSVMVDAGELTVASSIEDLSQLRWEK